MSTVQKQKLLHKLIHALVKKHSDSIYYLATLQKISPYMEF